MTFARLLTLALFVFRFAAPVQAFPCNGFTALSMRGEGIPHRLTTTDADVLRAVEAWDRDAQAYVNLYGAPLWYLRMETDGTREGRRYMLIYPDRADESRVVAMIYTYERMFGDHADPQLHWHGDCDSGEIDRADVDALIAALREAS